MLMLVEIERVSFRRRGRQSFQEVQLLQLLLTLFFLLLALQLLLPLP
jgi:hypothetical protein